MALLRIEDPAAGKAHDKAAIAPFLALGFRPFYLFGAAFAALSIPVWLGNLYGWLSLPNVGVAWHMHEMVYGFVVAIVIGFLFTAGRNWTGLWTPRGKHLAALVMVWLAGRASMLVAPSLLTAAIDISFLPLAAWPLYRVLDRSGNSRNKVLVVVLGMLALANLSFHADRLGYVDFSPSRPIYAALIMVVIIESIIAGRIIPNFTANAIAGANPVQNPLLDRVCIGLTIAAGAAWAFALPAWLAVPAASGAALLQTWRLAQWQPMLTLRQPLLWVLHLSYAWVPAGFALLGLAQVGLVPISAVVHVFGVGAMGGLIVGMITRTALGHTGRPLKAGVAETAMYVLIQFAVVARLVAALTEGDLRDGMLMQAGLLWSAAFAAYVLVYAPRLWAPRIDGKEG